MAGSRPGRDKFRPTLQNQRSARSGRDGRVRPSFGYCICNDKSSGHKAESVNLITTPAHRATSRLDSDPTRKYSAKSRFCRSSDRISLRAQAVDATPSGIDLLSKGGVYDPRETVWAFCGAEERHVVPLEGRTVVA